MTTAHVVRTEWLTYKYFKYMKTDPDTISTKLIIFAIEIDSLLKKIFLSIWQFPLKSIVSLTLYEMMGTKSIISSP